MYYMNLSDKRLDSLKNCIGRKTVQEEFTKKHDCYDRADEGTLQRSVPGEADINPRDLNWKLFETAGAIQGTELRGKVSLYDLFNEEEIYQNWVVSNSWWQMSYGNILLDNWCRTALFSAQLLRNIIEKADSRHRSFQSIRVLR